jgi:hypothetical protein
VFDGLVLLIAEFCCWGIGPETDIECWSMRVQTRESTEDGAVWNEC